MIDDREYWNKFYSQENEEKQSLSQPSRFANEISSLISKTDNVLELGCGNGRDSLYLKDFCNSLLAIDNSDKTIQNLLKFQTEKLRFINHDIKNIDSIDYKPTVIYSRFFLHSIEEETEEILFEWLKSIKNECLFLCECRSEKDKQLFKHYGNSHFRREVSLNVLTTRLEECGFVVEYSIESRGLSVYGEEDPFVIRVFARKR